MMETLTVRNEDAIKCQPVAVRHEPDIDEIAIMRDCGISVFHLMTHRVETLGRRLDLLDVTTQEYFDIDTGEIVRLTGVME